MPKKTKKSSDASRTRSKRVKPTPKAPNKFSDIFDQSNQQIIASVQEGIIVYDRSFKCRVWNPFMEERSGLSASQVFGKTFLEIMALERRGGNYTLSKESIEKVQECQRRVLAGETITHVDIPVFMKNHTETRYSSVRYDPLRDAQGEICGVLVTVHDTTERKRGEERLRESERQLAEAQQIARIGSWNWDIRANVVTWSEELFRIFGLKPQERIVSYETFINYVHPDDRDYIHEINREAMENHNPFHYDYRIVWDDGTVHRIHADGEVILDEEKRPVRMHGTAQDITAQKQAEEQLQRSEEELRKILTNIDEIIYSVIVEDNPMRSAIQFMSPRTEDIVGYRPEEFIEDEGLWFRILHPEDVPIVTESTRKILEHRSTGVREYRLRHKDTGEYRWLEDKVVPQVGDTGKVIGFFGVARDITERKRVEEALRKSEALLHEAVRASRTGIFIHDHLLETHYWSPEQREIYGWRPDEPVSVPRFLECIYPEDRETIAAAVRHAHDPAGDGRFDVEFRIIRRDGAIRWMSTRSQTSFANMNGELHPVRTVGASIDVTESKQAEAALQESQRALSTLLSNLPGMVYRCRNDKDWTVEFASEGCLELTGYHPSDLTGRKVSYGQDLIHPDDQGPVWDDVQAALREKRAFHLVYRIITANKKEKWVSEQGMGIFSSNGDLLALEGFITDISERRQAEEELKKSEAQNRALLNAMPDMMFRINREGIYLDFIPAKGMEPFIPPREFLTKSVREVLPAEVSSPIMHYVHQALGTGETQIFEYPLLEKGNRHDYEARIVVSGENEVLAIVRDITERKTQADALEYQALHDTLTDLPNRTLVLDRLRQAIHAAGREGKPLALLLMDLDRFKDVNDALGHHHGDLLLKQVGPRVLSVLRESDTIARLGGDEFAVLLPATDIDGATVTAQKILEALDRPFVVEGFFLEIGASIGIALFPEHGEDVDMLMRRADVAMYSAKQSSSGYAVYISEHDRHSPRRLALMGELRHAIERQEFVLYYQPKVDLKTRRTIGVEALIRWKHPQHGLIPPDEFIMLAEHTGFIKQLTFWVLSDVLRQWRVWNQNGIDLSVAVNLSARNLQDLQLPDQFTELFRTAGVAPRMLELEITESAIMADPSRAMEILTRLRSKSIRFSIDDFGAGYSSLGYLKKLPVDAVKVDKSFVLGMAANADDAVIVRSTIDLAHNLGLKVVAEGVESREVLDRLMEMGCDAAQGYYLSRPIPAEELTRWLNESPWGLKKA